MLAGCTLNDFLDGPAAARPVVMSDLDGCLISGGTVLPGANRMIERLGARLWIVSNNSSDTGTTLAARLAAMGLGVPPARLVLAGERTLGRLARQHPGARVALFAAPPLVALAEGLGLRPDRTRPEVALLARDPGFGFDDLAALMAMAHRGVPVWLSNPDPCHPGPDGTPRPETGALWAALTAAVPLTPAGGIGKPAPDLLVEVLEAAGLPAPAAVFLGDSEATDGAAARAAGVEFVLIRRPGAAPAAPREARADREAARC
jgi:pyridoxal phosphatase